MDLQVQSETVVSASDYTWLRNPDVAFAYAVTRTFTLAHFVEAVHYPEGRLKPGLFVGNYTGGAYSGLWGPYHDDTDAGDTAGLNTLAAVLLDAGEIRYPRASSTPLVGATGSVTASVLLVGTPAMIIRGNLPAMVESDGSTAYVPSAADIATLGMIDDAEGQVF